MEKNKLFDICYQTINNEVKSLTRISKQNVESEFDKIFEDEGVIIAHVSKHGCPSDVIFYHSVFSGTFIMDENYEGVSVKKKGVPVMKISRDRHKPVSSSYPRWDRRMFELYEEELNIEELLDNIE